MHWLLLIGGGLYLIVQGLNESTGSIMNLTDKAQWAKFLFDTIGETLPELGLRSRLIIVTHAALESGWGQASSHLKNTNNMFNITSCRGRSGCTDGWTGEVLAQAGADVEYAPAGAAKPGAEWQWSAAQGRWFRSIAQTWRVYPTYAAAVSDYRTFLQGPRYASKRVWPALEAGDINAFVTALSQAGYFTLPVASYLQQFTVVLGTASRFVGV